ncbi:MAG: hypothetical protein KJZ93_05335 [Caldilineaceae bacterium]|nr:hypothetical protein [Caldilineaceae bacterium]
MVWQFLSWYLIIQCVTVAALPLTVRLFANLADRGYAFAKSLGVLLVGLVLWLGVSYGLLRNETGGAWLALIAVASFSFVVGRQTLRTVHLSMGQLHFGDRATGPGPASAQLSIRHILFIELLFLLAFAGWAYVRAHDPAANHTEKPMDLMFMNSIWASPTYPPQDAWLSGYAISYYYFGYWLLTTLGRLAGQPPEIAYTLGQASWFGLLLIGSVGVGYNLLRRAGRSESTARLGGLLAAVAVGITGNAQVIFEWLYAQGFNVTGLARWFSVRGFPENAAQTGDWFIGLDWWWWRSSRVLRDVSLRGDHIEVIDEFPMFSYVLGDNHPHVLAMPFVLLVIGLAQNLFFGAAWGPSVAPDDERGASLVNRTRAASRAVLGLLPLGGLGAGLIVAAAGSLIFLNTWDFPPYWFLLMASLFYVLYRSPHYHLSMGWAALTATGAGIALAVGVVILYLPYFLTAQSQAGGFIPNFFNPTRLPQFLLMFGFGLCGVVALLGLAWPYVQPSGRELGVAAAVVFGGPLTFLAVSLTVAFATPAGREALAEMALPDGAVSHWPLIVERWSRQGFTFLFVGALLTVTAALIWRMVFGIQPETPAEQRAQQAQTFALLLVGLGLLLVYAPEFVYLRDNFGSRMNTIFKFYYQAWLLFGLGATYAIVEALAQWKRTSAWVTGVSGLSLLLIVAGLLFPIAAAYSKTGGFALDPPTLDAIAYVAQENPAELAAIHWVLQHTPPDAVVLQGIGQSYRANTARVSAATGRPTLLGWDGHESQWRGRAFGEMAHGRGEALNLIYRHGSGPEIVQALERWRIDYVYIGRFERSHYEITPASEERLARVMDLVFAQDDARIYQRRGG